jgi:ribosomal protein S18 acetylase RimI-like enzyme
VKIRPATQADALAVATVHVRSWQAAYPGLVPQPYLDSLTPEGRRGRWEEILAATSWPTKATLLLVDEPDDTVIGFVSFGPTRDEDGPDPATVAEVGTLYIDPDFWSRGAGELLLSAALAQLTEAGFAEVTLWALKTNERARRFYERRGWKLDGTTKLHDWKAFVATDVRYRLTLDSRGSPT